MSLRLPLRVPAVVVAAPTGTRLAIPAQFWVFAGFAVLYGYCETMNGNWSQLYLTADLGNSTMAASLALTVFWGMVTVGRVLFAVVQRWFPSRLAYHALPVLLVSAFVVITALPPDAPGLSVLAFGIGPVLATGVTLRAVFAASAFVAAALCVLSFAVARRRPSPAALHPRPMLASG